MLEQNGRLEGWFTGGTTRQISREEKEKEARRKQLGRSLRKFKNRGQNPYIPEISSYIQHTIFDLVYKYMEEIVPYGFRVDYYMNTQKEWFVTAPSTTILFEDELVSTPPRAFNGGKIWFRLFINGVEKNYDLEIEWNDKNIDIKITREEIRRLCHGISEETPRKSVLAAPLTYELWQSKYRDINQEQGGLYANLIKDLKTGIKTLGIAEQTQIIEKTVSAMVNENPDVDTSSAEYSKLIGKTLMKYREAQRNGS